VYGGAVRVWWPGVGPEADPRDHPLFFIHDRSESPEVIGRIVAEFERRGLLESKIPAAGAELPAVVTALRPWGADLKLAGGSAAYVHGSNLTRITGLAPERVLRSGQSVRVRVLGKTDADGRLEVSLKPFEPDPWERVAEEYRTGMVVEGVVDELRNFGAFVTALPGVKGLLHKSQISNEWVSHPEDFLDPGDRIAVRIVRMDRAENKIDLTLRGVAADVEPVPAVSVYPDGPSWLPSVADEPEPEALPAVVADLVREQDEKDTEQQVEVDKEPTAVDSYGEELALQEDEVSAGSPGEHELLGASPTVEIEALERTIESAREVEQQVASLFAGAEQRLSRLRAEAAQVRRDLDGDLASARLRVLEFAESEVGDLTGSTEAALADARELADELREQLEAAENDRRELLERIKQERARSRASEERVEGLRSELRAERDAAEVLRATLNALEPDLERQFIAEVRAVWGITGTATDRERYPWREPRLGPEFLASLERVHGISRERVVEVCAHVVSGRAADIGGLELHALRESEVGGAPQRVRADGAKAWRCSLQGQSPAARRLHYWTLRDGQVELAKIVYHDDYSIA
jgi:predicted RNA-binding protein with RPS1 domain